MKTSWLLPLAEGLTKKDVRLRRLNQAVIEEFAAGRVTSLADEEVSRLLDLAFGSMTAA